MSLQGTFSTSVQAMNTHAHKLSNISQNIANINTTGYKLQGSHFSTLLSSTTPLSQEYLSVKATDFREVDKQGNIAPTNRGFDVAINGRGFFVTNTNVDGAGGWQYTRDGSFFGQAVQLASDADGDGKNDVGTLLTTANGSYVYGWAADKNGVISEKNTLNSLTPLVFNNNSIIPSQATSNITLQANVAVNGDRRQNVGLPYIDLAGVKRTLTVGFTKGLNSEWALDMTVLDANNQPVPVTFDPPKISFGGIGQLVSPTNGQFSVTINEGSVPQTITLNLFRMTQLANGSSLELQNLDQDGFLSGRLQDAYFTKKGVLVGSYSNGQIRDLYKLPVARFDAENNLETRSGNIFLQSATSGDLELTSIRKGTGRTEMVVGALEQSNVDLSDQFARMIITQRAYSSAATVLRTADEMSQAAAALKR